MMNLFDNIVFGDDIRTGWTGLLPLLPIIRMDQ